MKPFDKLLKKIQHSLKQTEQEIAAMEQSGQTPPPRPQTRGKEIATAVVGFVIIALAICGIIFSILFFTHVQVHEEEAQQQARIDYYTDFLSPVVLFDTGEFTHPDSANNLSLLIPAFFKAQETVFAGEDREYVTETDYSKRYILREEDVQAAAMSLFGRKVICQTFTLDGLKFEYENSEGYFLSSITMRLAMYTPRIKQYIPTDTGAELIVEYMEVATGKEYRVGKTMKITLQGKYQKEIITAITQYEEPATE